MVLACLGLDRVARCRAADFLVRREHECHRQTGFQTCPAERLESFDRQPATTLHVEDARPEHFVALAADREATVERADVVHRIDMSEDQDARAITTGFTVELRRDNVTEALGSGRAR